jgi:hypothetical protein
MGRVLIRSSRFAETEKGRGNPPFFMDGVQVKPAKIHSVQMEIFNFSANTSLSKMCAHSFADAITARIRP